MDKIVAMIAGRLVHNFSSDADYTLVTTEGTNEDLYNVIELTDTGVVLTTGRNVIAPLRNQRYIVINSTAQTLTFKGSTGSGVAIGAGVTVHLACDGTDYADLASSYAPTEVGPVDASGGSANLDYLAGTVQRVTIGDGTDAALTFTNLPPTGKSVVATLRMELAGAVPSSITVQSKTVDTTGVTSAGEVIVEVQRIGTDWYVRSHHAS